MPRKGDPADSDPIASQKNPDGSTSHYDVTGDEIEKDKGGNWVKKSDT
jgi:hypothetical protein